MKRNKILKSMTLAATLAGLMLAGAACKKDDDSNTSPSDDNSSGNVKMSMTDAPVEDANVQGTFVTVAAIELDGEPFSDFEPQTIEISAYQNGRAKLLLDEDVAVGSYSEVTFVFDHETDVDGNSPGSYVLTVDGEKHALNTSGNASSTVTLQESFQLSNGGNQEFIIDLDLRKSVQRRDDGQNDQYEFVAGTSFNSAFRMHRINQTGMIKGEYNGAMSNGQSVIVYAYKKGTFSNAETEANAETDLRFENAETSASVDAQGNYTLAYLPEGEYEVIVASYEENTEGEAEFQTLILVDLSIGGSIFSSVTVDAETTINVDLGIL